MRHFFSTTLGQILAIIGCANVVTFALLIALLFRPGGPPGPPWPWPTAFRIASLTQILRNTPRENRVAIVSAAQREDMSLAIVPAPAPCHAVSLDTRDLAEALATQLHTGDVSVHACSWLHRDRNIQVLVNLGGGVLEVHVARVGAEPSRLTFPLAGALLFLCMGVGALSAWAIARVIRPLRRLSERADAFGREITIAPIGEDGPLEIRLAARAFNRMQERITQSLQNRTRMLAAISHDLRTPLTRMRLLLDTNPAEAVREKLLKDIELMHKMIGMALAFIRTGSDAEKKEWLDLGALIATLCDEYEETGVAIRYVGPAQIPLLCRPDAIQRMLANLIDNAARHGANVVVAASALPGRVIVEVTDDGPGIPEEKLKDVLEPFVRLDPSRAGYPGSVGLGLSIVHDIVRQHGGTLQLVNRASMGFTARISLPREETGRASP